MTWQSESTLKYLKGLMVDLRHLYLLEMLEVASGGSKLMEKTEVLAVVAGLVAVDVEAVGVGQVRLACQKGLEVEVECAFRPC
jgi:hypothetical protein